MPLSPNMTVWPGVGPPALRWTSRYEDGAESISSELTTNIHNGTHVDAPLHFLSEGATVDQFPIDPFIGRAELVDLQPLDVITAADLAQRVPANTERLLLRTANSARRDRHGNEFDTSFVALTVDAAEWVVDAGIGLVGIDYLSIAVYQGDPEIHRALMRAGVVILEGLVLDHVNPGSYELVCLPLLLTEAEGAPARAVLRPWQ